MKSCTWSYRGLISVFALLLSIFGVSGCASNNGAAADPPITVSVNPTAVSVQTGHTATITATVQNDAQNKGVTWTLTGCTGADCGTPSTTTTASGVAVTYTAPAMVPNPATVTLTATSVASTAKTAVTTITITAQSTGTVAVTVSPKRAGLTTQQAQTFAAAVTGSTNTSVNWEVDSIPGGNSTVGTISTTGVFTPPTTPGTHTVAARSVADASATGSATVYITDLAGVYTYHNDLNRDGQNIKEYALTAANVTAATFGKRFSCPIDASAYAQPLWVANVANLPNVTDGSKHNVILVATQHDTVYLFDADVSSCVQYWKSSLLPTGETWVSSNDVGTLDLTPDIGIVGTPVIDPATNTIYLDAKSKTTGASLDFHHRLHALNLINGTENVPPVDIAATVPNAMFGISTFEPLRENQRGGLALVNGNVYVPYGSHGDNLVYYGWLLGYNATTLSQTSVFNSDPGVANSFGGIWMSGGAPASDSSNNLYVLTGNGNFDPANLLWGDSFLKLSTSGGVAVTSYFTPSSQAALNFGDQDLGSGGPLLVDRPGTPQANLLIGGGKEGIMYVLDRANLGAFSTTDAGALQTLTLGNSIFSTPAYWQNTLYVAVASEGMSGHLTAFAFDSTTGLLNPTSTSQSSAMFEFPAPTTSISSQGTSNGIVWAIEITIPRAAILHAYDATNLGIELWNSATNSADQAGASVKFTVPTVANGKVYVGTATELDVYGLSPN